VHVHSVGSKPPDEPPGVPSERSQEDRHQEPLPRVMFEVVDDPAALHEGFEPPRCIAEAVDLNAVQFLVRCRSWRVRAEHVDIKVVDQAPGQLVHEAGSGSPLNRG